MKIHSLVFLLILYSISPICLSQSSNVDSLVRLAEVAKCLEKANLFNDIANEFIKTDPRKGYVYAEKALEISKDENDVDAGYYSMLTMGNALYAQGMLEETLALDLQILNEYGGLISKSRLAQLHTQLGNDYQSVDMLEKSIDHLLMALVILGDLDDSIKNGFTEGTIIVNHINIGSVCTKLENYDKADEHFREALRLSEMIGDSLKIAYLHNNMAINFQQQHLNLEAIEHYLLAVDYIEKNASISGVATLYNNISSVYLRLGNYELTLDYGNKAFKLAEEVNDEFILAKLSANFGITYIIMDKPDDAIVYIRRALQLAANNGYTEILSDSYNYLAQYHALKGNYEAAYQAKSRYVSIADSLYDVEMAASITELQTKYETEKKEQAIVLLTKDTEIKDLKIKRQNAFTYALIGVVILIIIAGFLWFSRLREKQMREKTELEKTNLETEQKLLRAQINPHFMFNALNSVQSYISGNDNLKAMTYLAKFSQLMRNILENSRKSMITLEEEVYTLTLYMELEATRFKDAFEFEVCISESIIPSRTYIPPMLIQPFVENAIKHGFSNLDRKGRLLVDFFAMNGTLSCKIEDNGIGRVKAQETNRSANMSHKSLGMTVIQERLAALSKARKVKAKCEIEDLANGTRVLLDMPFEVE
jgi:tetratricopeptide (TPR) repeat protein